MRKWLLWLCFCLFFNCQISGALKEAVSLQELRNKGLPTEKFEQIKISPKEMRLYGTFWEDLRYFPVAGRKEEQGEQFFFENSWHQKRTFGGERPHEGCDVFGKEEKCGYYPVLSITDGVIEQIGWLPLGGYRVGIRSPGGGYFYYAHLSSYAGTLEKGEKVKAGEILGFLGDTGYGEEGTRGKFPPHLHLGIYVQTPEEREHALNPYPVLQFLQNRQKNFFY